MTSPPLLAGTELAVETVAYGLSPKPITGETLSESREQCRPRLPSPVGGLLPQPEPLMQTPQGSRVLVQQQPDETLLLPGPSWPQPSYIAEDENGKAARCFLATVERTQRTCPVDIPPPVGEVFLLASGLAQKLMDLASQAVIKSFYSQVNSLHVRKNNQATLFLCFNTVSFRSSRVEPETLQTGRTRTR